MTKPLLGEGGSTRHIQHKNKSLYLVSSWRQCIVIPSRSWVPKSIPSPAECAQAHTPGATETRHWICNVGRSPAWVTEEKARWVCFWRDWVPWKDRTAWLLSLPLKLEIFWASKPISSSQVGQTHPSDPIHTHKESPICFFLWTKRLLLFKEIRRNRGCPSCCHWQTPGTGKNSLVFLSQM